MKKIQPKRKSSGRKTTNINSNNNSKQKNDISEKNQNDIIKIHDITKVISIRKIAKKIIKPGIFRKVKDLAVKLARKNIYLSLTGIDALNFHFTNPKHHNSFIDLQVIILPECTEENTAKLLEDLGNELNSFSNSYLTKIINDNQTYIVKDLVKRCSIRSNTRFSMDINQDICVINLLYTHDIGNTNYDITPFIIIELIKMKKDDILIGESDILDFQGIKVPNIYKLYNDINDNINKYKNDILDDNKIIQYNNWKYKYDNMYKIITQSDLTFSYTTVEFLIRRCFPLLEINNKAYSDRYQYEQISSYIHTLNAEEHNSKTDELRKQILYDYKDLKQLKQESLNINITLEKLINRAVSIKLLPNNNELYNSINNIFNEDLVYEVCQTIKGQ